MTVEKIVVKRPLPVQDEKGAEKYRAKLFELGYLWNSEEERDRVGYLSVDAVRKYKARLIKAGMLVPKGSR